MRMGATFRTIARCKIALLLKCNGEDLGFDPFEATPRPETLHLSWPVAYCDGPIMASCVDL